MIEGGSTFWIDPLNALLRFECYDKREIASERWDFSAVKTKIAYILGLLFVLFSVLPMQVAASTQEGQAVEKIVTVTLDNKNIEFTDPVFLQEGRVFVPLRSFADLLGASIGWNQDTREVTIETKLGDELIFTIDDPMMLFNEQAYRMDVTPFIVNQRTYLPIRHAAEFLHMDVDWEEESWTAKLSTVPLHLVVKEDTIESLMDTYQTTQALLLERNGAYTLSDIEWGDEIKVVIPEIMKHKIEAPPEAVEAEPAYDPEVLDLLSRIVQVEAGYEPYESQLAVANVVLNRTKAEAFPDTVREVIYAPGQFPPAHNGLLDGAEPGEEAIKAAKAALNGENNVEGALFFYNPAVTGGEFWYSMNLIAEIGNHRYVGP